MEKFSVKKPFTILVAVIIVIALGIISVTRISTDLLPKFSMPYLIVVTPYPGASPERVEASVTMPLENSLGTITGVKNLTSSSYENYALIQMEFESDTNMDSAIVKVSGAIDELSGSLPESVGTPTIMEFSMDMLATMYVAVDRKGYDVYELSDFVRDEVVPYMKRQEGVASVRTIGLVEKSVQVELNSEKIDLLNDRILEETNKALADAKKELDDAQKAVDEAQKELEEQKGSFGSQVSNAVFDQVDGGVIDAANSVIDLTNNLIVALGSLNNAVFEITQKAEELPDSALTKKEIRAIQKEIQEYTAQFSELIQQAAALAAQIEELQQQQTELQQQIEEIAKILEELLSIEDPDEETLASIAEFDLSLASLQEQLNSVNAAIAELAAQQDETSLSSDAVRAQIDDLEAQLAAAFAADEEASASTGTEDALETSRLSLEDALSSLSVNVNAIDASSSSALLRAISKISADLVKIENILHQMSEEDISGKVTEKINEALSALYSLQAGIQSTPSLLSGLRSGYAGITQAQLEASVGFSSAQTQLSAAEQQLSAAEEQYEEGKKEALKNANADALLSPAVLSGMIYAQNFEMPAGYIDDKDSNAWLLRIGDEYKTPEELSQVLLMNVEPIGAVRLADVADVTVIDNVGEAYSNLNGGNGVMVCIYKASTAGTNEVSRSCMNAFSELQSRFDGMDYVPMMDQGVYITYIIKDILSSMLLGAILAVIVLAIFLRAIKPTLIVAISIPLSVLFALVLIYFTNLSLNMMTLSGLALGIGMLVDNSIVVMENIYRLRNRGIAPGRAAVQGAVQVRGPIIASTLTTICVFLPAVFTSGTVRQLLMPLALTIAYCLAASLLAALTVVPAASVSILKNTKPKEFRILSAMQKVYGKSLGFCLNHKLPVLAVTIGLLVLSVWQLTRMGIVYFPEMSSNSIQVNVTVEDPPTREDAYAVVDDVVDRILKVDGVNDIGIMDEGSSTNLFTSFGGSSSSDYRLYVGYAVADSDAAPETIKRISKDIENAVRDLPCTVTASSSGLTDLTSFTSESGLTINIYGQDAEMLASLASELKEIISENNGFSEVRDGSETGDATLQLHISKDKATEYGLTVAGIYQKIASRLETSVSSTSITVNGIDMKVTISDRTDPLTRENLLDMEIETNAADMNQMSGNTGSFGSSSSFGSASGLEQMFSAGNDASAAAKETTAEKTENEIPETIRLGEIATIEETTTPNVITRENLTRYVTVSAKPKEGKNLTLLNRELQPQIDTFKNNLPPGYTISESGETSQISEMLEQMTVMLLLALLFIYLVMVAQFQSLLSPFIVMFTIPLAFTGGMLALIIAGRPLTLLALMGFLILIGTVVNNGIVFVDFANQLRLGGMERRDALIATGKTRMRPILMTALTTILAMGQLIFGKGIGSQLGGDMALVIAGGLIYATLMTLYIIPVMYDILFRRKPLSVDVGEGLDELPDDAAAFLAEKKAEESSGKETGKG
ncbi:MAG: efflux RND transporter permease subunit [Eubacterium sp.]|nr:efflux RND transporter permease subunit [Eubacterium sp.]